MIKLYIFNLEEFLYLADRCSGPVNLLSEGGKSVDIRNSCSVQKNLYHGKQLLSLNFLRVQL